MPHTSQGSNVLGVGWGRAAISRFSKAPEEIRAEVIKALEGKISVEFKDYSQWEREPLVQPTAPTTKKPITKPAKKLPPTRPLTGVSGTSCSSLCIHPWNKKAELDDNSAPDDEENKLEILNILVEAKKKSIVQYQSLCKDLKSQNNGLRKEIEEISSSTHRDVTELLEKYEDYASAAVAIKKNHTKEYYSARLELKCTSVQLQKELEYLEQEVLDLNARLRHFHEDLQVLRTYKDKEYPVKEMQISRLVKNLDDLYLQQKTEKKELGKVTGGEDLKLRMQHSSRIENILETAASNAFVSHTSAGVRHMAWHNNILRQEIEEHSSDVQDLEETVRLLQEEVKVLRKLPESNLRKTVFSGVFLSPERCHPDEEVTLDIPRQQPLPI